MLLAIAVNSQYSNMKNRLLRQQIEIWIATCSEQTANQNTNIAWQYCKVARKRTAGFTVKPWSALICTMAQEGHSPVLVFDSSVVVLHSPVMVLHSLVLVFTQSSFNFYTVQFYFLHSPVLFLHSPVLFFVWLPDLSRATATLVI